MPAQNDYSAVPGNAVTPEAVAGRDAAMFVVGAAEPVPSGMPPLASEPNKALVKVAVAHFAGVPKAHIGALSKSFGNFDRVVGIGWVIADAVRPLGAPLITRAEAHAIGGRAQRKAGDIKDEVRTARLAIQRAAYKLDASDPKRQELDRQLADAEALVLRESIELPLPSGAPQAASSATGSRKCAREHVPSYCWIAWDGDCVFRPLHVRYMGVPSSLRLILGALEPSQQCSWTRQWFQHV